MVIKVVEVVLDSNDKKVGCDESNNKAQYVLDMIERNVIKTPLFG